MLSDAFSGIKPVEDRHRIDEVALLRWRGALTSWMLISALTISACGDQAVLPKPEPTAQPSTRHQLFSAPPTAKEVRLFIEYGKTKTIGGGTIAVAEYARTLTPAERSVLESKIRPYIAPIPPPDASISTGPACFIPHHYFRYFDASGKQVGEISVCFCCNGVAVEPNSPVPTGYKRHTEVDYAGLRQLVTSMGLPVNVGCDPPP